MAGTVHLAVHPDEAAADGPRRSGPAIQEEATTLLLVAPEYEGLLISEANRKDFSRLDTTVRRGVAAFVECGLALAEIHARNLWRAGSHPTWEGYLRSVLGMSKPHAHRLVRAARIATEISETLPIGNAGADHVRPASESKIRPLWRLKDAGQRATAWLAEDLRKQIRDEVAKGGDHARLLAQEMSNTRDFASGYRKAMELGPEARLRSLKVLSERPMGADQNAWAKICYAEELEKAGRPEMALGAYRDAMAEYGKNSPMDEPPNYRGARLKVEELEGRLKR